MQTMPHTPAHAQHIPDGWSFPTLTAATPPPAMSPQPVTGGGAAPSTVTRVRWGRVLPLFAGVALVAFGIWSVTNGSSTTSGDRTVSGGGTSEVGIDRAIGSDAGAGDDATGVDSSGGATADTNSSTGDDVATPPAAAPAATPPARAAAPARPRAGTVRGGGGRTGRRGAAVAPAVTPGTASAATAPRARAGGGAPAGELPLTGIETWIAGILGVVLLTVGICVHVSAVRIATTALLYRRGILLRPTECARLAQDHGLAQVRVAVSNVLHRLLEEPTRSDFVSTRHAI